MVMDTSKVTPEDVQNTRILIKKYGYGGLAFSQADEVCGHPTGTMASYFGKCSGEKRKRKKLQEAKKNFKIQEKKKKEEMRGEQITLI